MAQTGELLEPLGVQDIEEKRNLPLGGELRGHPEGVLCINCASLIILVPLFERFLIILGQSGPTR